MDTKNKNIKDKLKTIPLSQIKLYDRNAKIHNAAHVNLLKGGLEEYDYVEAIIVGKDNTIVGGHGRYLAMMEENPDQDVEVVDVSYLTEEQQKKLRIF